MSNNYSDNGDPLDIESYTSQIDMYQDFDLPFYYNLGGMMKFEGPLFFFFVTGSVITYFILAISLQKIAKKTRVSNDWYAWVPLLNLSLLLKIVNKSQSLIFLFFIPVVGFLFGITIWIQLAIKLSKPRWVGVLAAIPFVNVFAMLYLAYAESFMREDISDIATIKSVGGAFAYDSRIIEKDDSLMNDDQKNNLNQLEKDLRDLEEDSLRAQDKKI